MEKHLPKSTHDGVLTIGSVNLECHVLEDKRRIFSSTDLLKAFNLQSDQKDQPRVLRLFLDKIGLISIGHEELSNPLMNPIRFICKGKGGHPRKGYLAELIPEICNATIKLASRHMIPEDLRKASDRARELLNGFAKVGIIALIDEATGYQEIRDKEALQEILDKYLLKEYAKWAKRFPDEFYIEMFKLKGWQWIGMQVNRPSVVGTYTNDIVYDRLAPGILAELCRKNPPNPMTHQRKSKHHQWLTDDIGHPALNRHLYAVVALMKASINWASFHRALVRAFPKPSDQPELPMPGAE